MIDCEKEIKERVEFIRKVLSDSGCDGIIFGNSGGKDSALVGILCKLACANTLGVIMPCSSTVNYGQDRTDALELAQRYEIKSMLVDLTSIREEYISQIKGVHLSATAKNNLAPRIRMTTLYAIAASQNRLVAGTSNRSERYVGYFTKWGDNACDFNPISDLTTKEVYILLDYLECPRMICRKKPSAGLVDGQTDEADLGFSYKELDDYLLNKTIGTNMPRIQYLHDRAEHKINGTKVFQGYKD